MGIEKSLSPVASQAACQPGLEIPAFCHWRSLERFLTDCSGSHFQPWKQTRWLLQLNENKGKIVDSATVACSSSGNSDLSP